MTGLKVSFNHAGRVYQFRRPQLGNQDELSFQRINRKTRSGDLIVFRDNEWPKTEIQVITFDFNTDAEARAMLNMIHDTLGTNIYYTDHENKTWYGFIQNPDTEVVSSGRNHHTITLKFEGDLT